MAVTLHEGDCLDILPTLPDASVDCVVTDPPYPEIDREYGRWTEEEWWTLMMGVCSEVRRVLKPTGSAVFILQPNSRKVGSMRPWLFDFMAWACREWNLVQDAWWWNPQAMPTLHCASQYGLMRSSLKACVWCGPSDCYRDQGAVLIEPAAATMSDRRRDDDRLKYSDSSHHVRHNRSIGSCVERGGATPFNVIESGRGGVKGHGAGTPEAVCHFWVRYLCPPGGVVLDPFGGSGTTGLVADREGRLAVLVERHPPYCDIIRSRLQAERAKTPLFPDE